MAQGSNDYLTLRNRYERLETAPDGSGYKCDWKWTSDLHAIKVLPTLGRALMRRALREHPIAAASAPATKVEGLPDATFIIGHRGMARLPHLLSTLESIAAQSGATVECVVVEQDVEPQVAQHLPQWVRHIHTALHHPQLPYCRGWAFNIGAQHARSEVLILHDNDMLVPADYVAGILNRLGQGFDVVNPKRFIFYLGEEHSRSVMAGTASMLDAAPEVIVQNLEGGGSVAIRLSSYENIGGLDESFVGWGGEDNEFWERAQTLRVWPWAWLPLVHLWHPAQPGKRDSTFHTADLYRKLAHIDPKERIQRLNAIVQGRAEGPAGWPNGSHAQPSG